VLQAAGDDAFVGGQALAAALDDHLEGGLGEAVLEIGVGQAAC